MISERHAEAEDRAPPGHWEGDLIIGKDGGSAIGTLVERATRYAMLLHLPDDHGAEAVPGALTTTGQTLPAQLKRSLTWDQSTDPSVDPPEHLVAVADQLNRSPRKTLGWKTPAERLHKLLAA